MEEKKGIGHDLPPVGVLGKKHSYQRKSGVTPPISVPHTGEQNGDDQSQPKTKKKSDSPKEGWRRFTSFCRKETWQDFLSVLEELRKQNPKLRQGEVLDKLITQFVIKKKRKLERNNDTSND